jgi:cation diffusion facilitator CzcD-associated flavoprotein CzcO
MMQEFETDVCVIGAGWSGLYALKYVLQYGMKAIAIEQKSELGGLWGESTEHMSAPDVTYTSSAKLFTEATDFPWADEIGLYPHKSDIHAYLDKYVSHFSLREKIWFNTLAEQVTKHEGLWRISSRKTQSNACITIVCKNIIVCTGVNSIPNNLAETDPKYQRFTGEIIPSHTIKIMSDFESKVSGKVVVAIGGGESASDITYYLSKHSKSFTLCIPNGHWMQIREYYTSVIPINELAPVLEDGSCYPWEYQKTVFRNIIRPMWGSNVSIFFTRIFPFLLMWST